MSDNIGGVFLTLLTWMMGILLGLNALWFGWQVNQVNDYNTQVGQMISKEGGYDQISGQNAAELSAQSYHNHFALYSWVPGNKDADNRPVKGFRVFESVTQAHGDRIRYRIKAQIPLIAFVPKFKWTHTFDETVVSNAGNHSANHAGLHYAPPFGGNISYNPWNYGQYSAINKKLKRIPIYEGMFGDDWAIHYANDAYDAGFLTVNPWTDASLTVSQQRMVAKVYAQLASGTVSGYPMVPGVSYSSSHQPTANWPYVTNTELRVPLQYLNGYSSRDADLRSDMYGNPSQQRIDWSNDAMHTVDYETNGRGDVNKYQPSAQGAFAAPGKVSLWLRKDWDDNGVYRSRLHQLTGGGSKHPAGEVTQAN